MSASRAMAHAFCRGWRTWGRMIVLSVRAFVLRKWISAGLAAAVLSALAVSADAQSKGAKTGLPLPRFVSLKSKSVNLRVGPGRQYNVAWLYVKPGLPLEVVQEFDQWRRVRDAEGTEGWIFHSLLSGNRTAIVAPWEKAPDQDKNSKMIDGHATPDNKAAVTMRLQPGVLVSVEKCQRGWCLVNAENTGSFVRQQQLWGVYPNETVKG